MDCYSPTSILLFSDFACYSWRPNCYSCPKSVILLYFMLFWGNQTCYSDISDVILCYYFCYSVLFCVILCYSVLFCVILGKEQTQNNRITVILVQKLTSQHFIMKKHAKLFQTSFSIMITKLQEMSSCYHKKNRDFVHSISIYIGSKKSWAPQNFLK